MKRINSIIAAVASLLIAASCVDELEKEGAFHGEAVTYKAVAEGTDTKAVLGTDESGRTQSMWENGDQITIHNGISGYEFTTSASDGSPIAEFVYEGDDFTAENGVIAIYPAGDYTVDMENLTAMISIPKHQVAVAGSYDRTAVPSVAYSVEKSLYFRNMGGLIKFNMNMDDVATVRFSANGAVITGTYYAQFDNGNVSYNYIPDVEEYNYDYVELSAPAGQTFQKGSEYYISVMPNGYSGFLVEFLGSEGQTLFTKSYSGNVSVRRNRILNLGSVGSALQPYGSKYVVGTYNAWRHEYNTYLYDFDGSDKIYEGVVDFNACGQWGTSINEFKFTGGNWGVGEYSRASGDYFETEQKVVPLVEGSGDNINAYQQYRFCHFTLNSDDCTLTRNYAFNSIGVTGLFNGWDNYQSVEMNFNPETQKFWVDIEFTEDGELKFLLDKEWTTSFGCKGNSGRLFTDGDNIPVAAGQYRIYVDLNDLDGMTYEFDSDAYGTEEYVSGKAPWIYEPEPEPEPVEGWALIGEFNSWNGDELMTETEPGLWVITGFELEADQQWKLRKDGEWIVNRGGQTGGEPYYISVGESFVSIQNGPNMAVAVSGTYDIIFNEQTDELLVKSTSTAPSPDDYVDEYGINRGPGIEIDGVVWAPVNCGYHETDYKWGKLYQWGRKYGQGYDCPWDKTYDDASVPVKIQGSVNLAAGQSEENANKYYYQSVSPFDWCTTQDSHLWNVGTNNAPVKTEYDPCPAGWRVPTYNELLGLSQNRSSWTTSDGQNGYWLSGKSSYTSEVSQIFFPAAGYRRDDREDGVDRSRGGYYYSSSAQNFLMFYSSYFTFSTISVGASVRCVKDDSELITVENITLDKTELSLEGGETYTLTASIAPSTANHKSAHWYSDNSAIVSVDQNGQLTAKSSGTTTITAMAGMQKATCRVTVVSTVPSENDYIDEYGINCGPGIEISGLIWAPVNCGYKAPAGGNKGYPYGKLYQYGRKYGQGYSGDYDEGVISIENGGVSIITGNLSSNADVYYLGESALDDNWTAPETGAFWNLGTDSKPVKTEYDPCPEGWRVPTYPELYTLCQNSSWGQDAAGTNGRWFSGASSYASDVPQIFLPASGYRSYYDGEISSFGDYVHYWSSSINSYSSAKGIWFTDTDVKTANSYRSTAFLVRCIKDDAELIAVSNITLDMMELSLEEDEACFLEASITPLNANHQEIYWTSDNAEVATVTNNGKVTAVAPGKAVITAVAGMKAAVCEVTVNAKPDVPVEETKEVTLWQGAALVDDYNSDPTVFVLSDGGAELIQAGAKPGQVIYFYVEPLDTDWYLYIYEGHWSEVFSSLNSFDYDLDANGGKIGLTLTEEILATACNPQYWGGTFLLLGDNIKLTKVTIL